MLNDNSLINIPIKMLNDQVVLNSARTKWGDFGREYSVPAFHRKQSQRKHIL